MRFNINLATQPYQDVQRFFVRWGLAMFAVALLTAGLIYSAGTAFLSWRNLNKDVRTVRAQIAEREREKSGAEAVLARPENRDTRDRSQFLNTLIARKAFSWTEVFSDLEKIVPPRLHVVSIRPIVNERNQLELHLSVAGSSHESAIELVRRLEESPHFTHAEIMSDTEQTAAGPDVDPIHVEVRAIYLPAFAQRRAVKQVAATPPQQSQQSAPPKEARNAGR
jgi:type IV pilus assembly protein PilN